MLTVSKYKGIQKKNSHLCPQQIWRHSSGRCEFSLASALLVRRRPWRLSCGSQPRMLILLRQSITRFWKQKRCPFFSLMHQRRGQCINQHIRRNISPLPSNIKEYCSIIYAKSNLHTTYKNIQIKYYRANWQTFMHRKPIRIHVFQIDIHAVQPAMQCKQTNINQVVFDFYLAMITSCLRHIRAIHKYKHTDA